MTERHETINISTISILKILLIVLVVWFLFAVREIVLIFLISIIISSAIDPLADFLYRKRIPRALSVLLVYAVLISLLVLIISLLVPPITEQFKAISESDYASVVESKLGIFKENLVNLGVGKTLQENLSRFGSNISNALFQTTKGIFTGLLSLITIFVISFYLTAEENGIKNFIKHLTPYKHQPYIMRLTNKIQRKIGAWVLGQIILSAIIFGLSFIGLTLLKVEFALVLALFAGVLEIIPFIGPIVAGLIAAFFAFLQNPTLALVVLILYAVIQQLENHIIVPVVMSKSVGLNPISVILAILIGGSLGGIIGALIAVPVLAGASVFFTDLMEEKEMHEHPSG